MSEHAHAEGIFCDDCPDAMQRLIHKHLVEHRRTNDYLDERYCICGWSPDFTQPLPPGGGLVYTFQRHQADVVAAALATAGFTRLDPPTVLALLDRVLDPVTARDTIARAAYESAKSEHPSVRTWHELDETVRDHWRRLADAIAAALASQERGE